MDVKNYIEKIKFWLECDTCGNAYNLLELNDDKKFNLFKIYDNWNEYCYVCKNCDGIKFFIKIETNVNIEK